MICAAGVDVNHLDKDDTNALYITAKRTDNVEVYKALIECGIDVNYVPTKGPKCDIISLFIDYAGFKNPELIQLFLDSGLNQETLTSDTAKGFVEAMLSGDSQTKVQG